MVLDAYAILIILSTIVVLSYLFDLITRWARIPSVLLLIATGIGLRYLSDYLHVNVPNTDQILEILGIIGLILIVLEGSLDLKLSRDKAPMIRKSLSIAFFALIITSLIIAWLLNAYLNVSFLRGFVNAIPFAVISSAVAIPSVGALDKAKKEFIVYESTFSDILGIMLFNFAVMNTSIGSDSFVSFGINLVAVVGITIVSVLLLLFFIDRIKLHIKFFLIISLLIFIYAIGKIFHLSSLLMVLAFGLAINNTEIFLGGRLKKFFRPGNLVLELRQLNLITAESAFLIRTFFFILFGFSLDLTTMRDPQVWIIGSLIILIILVVRLLYLKFIVRTSIFPELFVAPRGLITILLFFSIPSHFIITGLSRGILLYVVLVTSILMLLGILFSKKEAVEIRDYM